MPSESAFTEAERDRIKAFAESGNPSDLVAGQRSTVTTRGRGSSVSRDTCREWRKAAHNEPASAIAYETSWSAAAVRKHSYGYCNHDESMVGEPADTPGQGPGGGHQ